MDTSINATDFSDGIRFTNCLFQDQMLAFQAFTPRSVKVTSGDVSFVHCSFIKFGGMSLSNSNVYLVNSLMDSVQGAIWNGTQQIHLFSSLVNFNVPANWQPQLAGAHWPGPLSGTCLPVLRRDQYPDLRRPVTTHHLIQCQCLPDRTWRQSTG